MRLFWPIPPIYPRRESGIHALKDGNSELNNDFDVVVEGVDNSEILLNKRKRLAPLMHA